MSHQEFKFSEAERKRHDELNAELQAAIKINELENSDGWKNYLLPMIEKTILSTYGGKFNDKWIIGLAGRQGEELKGRGSEFYIGCAKTCIEILEYVKEKSGKLESLRNNIALMTNQRPEYVQPLINGSYSGEKKL